MIFFKPKQRGRALLFSTVLMVGLVVPAFVNARSSQNVLTQINALEFQARGLGQSLDVLNQGFTSQGLTPPENVGAQPRVHIAQSRDVAAVNLRLSQIEEQMRILTGQVEGLQFQMTQFQTLIERLQEDNEFRFQQLEGGGSGKTEAVAQSGGDRPTVELPQIQNEQSEDVQSEELQNIDLPMDFGGEENINQETLIGDGESEFVLPDGAFGENLFGTSDIPDFLQGEGTALDLNFDPGELVTQGDADAQYRAGYEAVVQGDYAFAEMQFRQFVALFPEHHQAPDAVNWLGEALLQRGQYDEAAQVLFTGFEAYQNTTRGPDLLLRLGVALAGAGERDTACRTFVEVLRRYPNMDVAFHNRVGEEMVQTQC